MAALHLAWLMWCYRQGYTNPRDRAIPTNWMLEDPDTLTADDRRERAQLILMEDRLEPVTPEDERNSEQEGKTGEERGKTP